MCNIISEILFVVNWDSDNNFTSILDKLKTDVLAVTNAVTDFYQGIDGLPLDEVDWEMFSDDCDFADKQFIKFVNDTDVGNRTLENYQQYLAKASSSTAKFTAALKSMAANIGIMIAVNAAIKLVQYAWDKANTTVEEVTKRIDELSDSISTLEGEYNSLKEVGSENLTDAELARLDYLEDRITKEKELKELEEARLIREKYGSDFTDYFDDDNYNAKYSDFREKYFNGKSAIDVKSLGIGIDQNNQSVINIGSKVDEYNVISEEIQAYIDQMKQFDQSSLEYSQLDNLKNERENELAKLVPDLQEEYQNYKVAKYEAEKAIEEMTTDLDNPNLTDRDKEIIQGWISEYENVIKIADYYIEIMKDIPAIPTYTDTDSYTSWFNSLSDADKELVTSDEFKQALEEQRNKENETLSELKAVLEDEYAKIGKFGLDDYADQIKNGTIQSVFGNVDMDKRTIITWSDELKQTYQDELASWDYDPEIGTIDTVYGMSDRFGESLSDNGWEVAFTPILPDGTFLSKDTVYDYIETILQQAYADDGQVTDEELKAIDAQGMQIGDTFVKGIYAGIDGGLNYDNNGNWAETVGRLMHFSGDFGAIQIAENDINNFSSSMEDASLSADDYAEALQNVKDAQSDLGDEPTTAWTLSEEQSDAVDDFETKVKTLGEALSSLQSGESITGMTDLLQEFPALATESGNLEEAIKRLIYEALEELYSILGEDTPTTFKDSLQSVADEASGVSMPLDEALSKIQKTDTALRDFKAAMSKDGLTDDILNTVAGLSTSLNDLVAGFYAGTVSADELFTALTKHYNTDLENYANALIAKNKYSEDFYKAVGLNSAELVNSLKNNYGVDISNCKSYNEAKLQIESQTLKQISSMWSKYYNAQSRALTTEGEELAKKALLDGDPTSRRLLDKIMAQTKAYESAMDELDNIAYQGISANFSGISSAVYNNSNNSSKSDSDKETEETFDFVETKLERLTNAYDDVKDKAEDTFSSMIDRAAKYSEAISENINLINAQNQAYDAYMAKANSVGLDEVWASQVRDGNFNIATVTDENLKDKINDYQEWYEKAIACKETISELITEQKELNQSKIQLDIDVKTNEFDKLESKADNIQSKIDDDKKKTNGGLYDKLSANYENQIANLNEQNQLIKMQQGYVANGSEQWEEYQNKIDENKKKIRELTDEIQENTIQKIQIDIDVKTNALDKLESKLDRIQKKIEFKEFFGWSASKTNYTDMMTIYTKQIENIGATNKLIKEQQKNVAKGSDRWKEYQTQIDSNNASVQDLLSNLAQTSQTLANTPITKAETKNEKLDKKDAIYDEKINNTTSSSMKNRYINKQVSNINNRNDNYEDAWNSAKSNISSSQKGLKSLYSKNKKSSYSKLFKEAYNLSKSGKKISNSLLTNIQKAVTATAGDENRKNENKQLQKLLRYCFYWNNRLIAEEEAEYNYKMSLLTTPSDRKEKWDTQRDNTINYIETALSSATSGNQYTKNSKNYALSAQNSALKRQNSAYHKETTKAAAQINYKKKGSDAKSAYSKVSSALKKASGKYKKALKNAQKCIKAKKAISDSDLKIIKENNVTVYENCALYNQDLIIYENAKYEEAVNYAATSSEIHANRMEKYDNRIAEQDRQDEVAIAKAANQTTAKNKNKYIDQQIKNVDDRLNIYKDKKATLTSDFNKKQKSLVNKKVSSAKAANAKKTDWETYKKYVEDAKKSAKSGKEIKATTITKLLEGVGKGAVTDTFYKLCVDYNACLQDKEQAEDEYELYKETAQQEKADLAMQKFNNITQKYDNLYLADDQKKEELNNKISMQEARGEQVDTKHYDELILAEKRQNVLRKEEAKKLQKELDNALADGTIKKGSDEWYTMQEGINAVKNEITQAEIAIQNYKNAIREINWDTFDKGMESMKRLNNETDYYINLMSHKDLIDDDTGDFTEHGIATLSMHNVNYDSYIKQAEEYQKEYNNLMKQIESGEASLSDENVINRLRELQDAHRDAKLAAEDELESITDLIKQGYEAQIDSLSKLIEQYKKLKDNELDAYNYQKSIAEKTKNIAALYKQLRAYNGNTDTEETRAQIQKLKVELEDAKSDLKDTQYEKFVSDTEDMLDDLMDDYQEFIDEKLSDINIVLEEANQLLEGKSDEIISTLEELDDNLTSALRSLVINSTSNKTSNEDDNIIWSLETDMKGSSFPGYAKGSKHISQKGLAWTQENGSELIYRSSDGAILTPVNNGDMVFTNEMSQKLWEMAQMSPTQFGLGSQLISKIPDVSKNINASTTIEVGDIVMNGVNDMEAFGKQLREEICRNGKTTQCITEAVSARQLGKNGIGNARLYK